MTEPSKRSVLVTGGASGIGRGIVQAFVDNGFAVAALDKDAAKLAGLREEVSSDIVTLPGDVASWASVQSNVSAAAEAMGGLDILVNCAGIRILGTVLDLSEEQWDAQMSVNAKGVFLCMKAALPFLRRSEHASIVNMSSVSSVVASEGRVGYCASKGAVMMLTKATAVDLAPEGITVNSVCPGVIRTGMHDDMDDPGVFEEKIAKTPLRRLGEPSDVAAAVLYLVDQRYVTGTQLFVDGGWTAV